MGAWHVQVRMIRCGLASGYKVWYLATEDKIWYNRFAKLLRQHDTGTSSSSALPPSNPPYTRGLMFVSTLDRACGR